MPQDFLQIALEHHRAGRLRQAEAGYRGVVAVDPNNADALHWLGVLLFQAGQFDDAVELLEKAVAIRPNDPAYLHNLAMACQSAGQKDRAIQIFERAAAADSSATEALVALAQARLQRRQPGDAEAAVAALRQAQAGGLDTGECWHQLGVALLAAAKPQEAIDACKTSLVKKPDHALTLYHLALAHRSAGQLKETRKCLIKSLELEPTFAQGWCALAMLDAEAGNLSASAGLFRRAISADRNCAAAYQGLSQVLHRAGKHEEARAALSQGNVARQESPAVAGASSVAELEKQLTPTPLQAHAHFAMAALMNIFPPTRPPADAVAGLFDRYADYFDRHLVGSLEYHTPEVLAGAIAGVWDQRPMDILDMGCGTGLCGPLLRPMARALAGVDLSPQMIEKAGERHVYDRLEVGDLVASLVKAPQAYDLLVAADVLIYIGDLSPTFEAAVVALRPGGMFAFSVEVAEGDRYELVKRSRRFAHSKPYLQHMARIYGFEEKHFEPAVLRKEAEKPVMGYVVMLRLPHSLAPVG